MKHQAPETISTSVMKKIKDGEVHMKPRMYYTLLGLTSVGAVILSGIMTAYLLSIMFFWLRIQTADTMAYGARANLANSIDSFPAWALLASVLLLTLAIVLAHRYRRIYKYKLSTVAAVLIACSLILGLGLSFFDIGKSHTPAGKNKTGQYQTR